MSKAVYPGSFDPITLGHLDVIRRGCAVFDELVVAVARNEGKKALFDVDERLEMIRRTIDGLDSVSVAAFDGLSVDFVRAQGAHIILRGIRTVSDFEYEFQIALMNRGLDQAIETVFVMSAQEYAFIHASLLKEVVSAGGSVSAYVAPFVEQKLRDRLLSAGP